MKEPDWECKYRGKFFSAKFPSKKNH